MFIVPKTVFFMDCSVDRRITIQMQRTIKAAGAEFELVCRR
jgi:hypothetical protein